MTGDEARYLYARPIYSPMQHRWHAEIVDWRDGSVFAVTIDYRQCWADAHGHASDIITDIRWPIAV